MGHIVMMCNFEVDEKTDQRIMQRRKNKENQ